MPLGPEDRIGSTHRGHGHCIAKGVDVLAMMAEIYGKVTGACRGKGGSMHIADLSLGMMGANGIVGGGPPLVCGAALAAKQRGTGGVGVAFFGDGASNQGTTLEALNLATVWNLPAVFVAENNGYAESTAPKWSVAGHCPVRRRQRRARPHRQGGGPAHRPGGGSGQGRPFTGARGPAHRRVRLVLKGGRAMARTITYRQAVNEALRQEMERDETVLVMGEDNAGGQGTEGERDAWGGVLGVTKGLYPHFGDRVLDTPITESAFIGAAIGAAACGMRPVAELMFIDFMGVCFDQIFNQAAKFRYMFGGKAVTPVVIRTMIGAGLRAAGQHSH